MAAHITRWSPDTCGCVLEYVWDDAVDPALRVHTPVTHDASGCSIHAAPATVAAGYVRVNDENGRKNKMYARVVTWMAANHPDLLDTDANGVQTIKAGNFLFSYDATGLLTVTFPNLTAAQKAQVQAAADSLVGANKILVR